MSGALVIFSGGQDSTTCLFWARERFENVRALSFFYGQRHSIELDMARSIAGEARVPLDVQDVSFISRIGRSSLTDAGMVMDSEKPEEGWPNTFVPGRNMFFLGVAAVWAREHGMRDIVTGVSQTDFSGYPDCRDTFIRSMNVTLNLAMNEQFVLHTPLMWLDKAQTWELADQLGIFDLVRTRTVTCYNGIVGDGCGECPSCRLRRQGLERYLERKRRAEAEACRVQEGAERHA